MSYMTRVTITRDCQPRMRWRSIRDLYRGTSVDEQSVAKRRGSRTDGTGSDAVQGDFSNLREMWIRTGLSKTKLSRRMFFSNERKFQTFVMHCIQLWFRFVLKRWDRNFTNVGKWKHTRPSEGSISDIAIERMSINGMQSRVQFICSSMYSTIDHANDWERTCWNISAGLSSKGCFVSPISWTPQIVFSDSSSSTLFNGFILENELSLAICLARKREREREFTVLR